MKKKWGRPNFHLGALLSLRPIFKQFDLWLLFHVEAAASATGSAAYLNRVLIGDQMLELRVRLSEFDTAS